MTFSAFTRPRARAVLCTVGLALIVALWPGCDRTNESSEATKVGGVKIVISGDTGPWIVPCGCTANQSGGLPRRATYLAKERQSGGVVYVDVGGAAAGTTDYFKEKFHAVLRGEVLMGVAAHNLGKAELALGPAALAAASAATNAPFVSANTRRANDDQALFPGLKIVTTGGRRVAFVGVVSERFATPDVRVTDARQEIMTVLTAARSTFDSAVVLAYMPDDELQQLASALPEVDAVVGGPTGQAQAPRRVGPTLVASATNKGKFLIRLDAPTQPAGAWSGDVVEIGPSFADDTQQSTNLQKYLARLADLDLPAVETGLITPITHAPDSYRVAGSASCVTCHADEHASWLASAHSHAGLTLEKKGGFQVDAYCLTCHTTNFGLPGGFESPKRSAQLMAVGCESCHGPSGAHVERPTIRTAFVAADQCIRCHDHENSPAFNQATYWAKIRHGKGNVATTQPGIIH